MESNLSDASEPSNHNPDDRERAARLEAQELLTSLEADGARLADRVVTPPWYHPALGGIVAVLVFAQALPGAYPLFLVMPALIALPLLSITYSRKYGVAFKRIPNGRSKGVLYAMIFVLIACLIAASLLKLQGASIWWSLIPTAIAGISMVPLGRKYDQALRDDIASGADRHA